MTREHESEANEDRVRKLFSKSLRSTFVSPKQLLFLIPTKDPKFTVEGRPYMQPPANRMKPTTKCFVFGLLCFTLGGICLTGYFLTPSSDYTVYSEDPLGQDVEQVIFSDKSDALPFGVTVMSLGFLVVLSVIGFELCNQPN
ncbi:hypothetical protein ACROYT_G025902 [Oculina patagonica]